MLSPCQFLSIFLLQYIHVNLSIFVEVIYDFTRLIMDYEIFVNISMSIYIYVSS